MAQEEAPQVEREIILRRLRRIEGQIRGVQKMIAGDRDCESIVTQLAAIRSAIDSSGALVLNNYMKICFRRSQGSERDALDSLARVVGIWGRVHIGEGT